MTHDNTTIRNVENTPQQVKCSQTWIGAMPEVNSKYIVTPQVEGRSILSLPVVGLST